MKLCTVICFLLLYLHMSEAKANKCGSSFLDGCFCGLQFDKKDSLFVVNCTGQGFTSTDVLKNLPKEVQSLIFTGNHISTLPSNVFGEDLSELQFIDMSNNGIRDIKGKAFHHVLGVERLILNHNNISISEEYEQNFHHPRVFSNFNNLEELHLTNAFADNTGVSLADNLHDIFVNSNLTKLLKLHLEQNEIINFGDERVFCDLPSLQQLYLEDNYISSLNFNITCLHKLQYLDLGNNNITKFSQRDLDTFDKLATPYTKQTLTLGMQGNPFKCDDAIKNLYDWMQTTKIIIRNLNDLECHQNSKYAKVTMKLKNFAESKHAKISQALTVLLVILVIILITLLSAYVYLKKENVRGKLAPIFEAVSRKVQYTTIETQDV